MTYFINAVMYIKNYDGIVEFKIEDNNFWLVDDFSVNVSSEDWDTIEKDEEHLNTLLHNWFVPGLWTRQDDRFFTAECECNHENSIN